MVNAFWLDRELKRIAAWLVDRHVTSSVFECSMVLTTVIQLHGYPESDDLYFTHPDNSLTRWAARSLADWENLHDYTESAHEEWRYRWDHDSTDYHNSREIVQSLDDERVRNLGWPTTGREDQPQLTGEWTANDYVDAYWYYYANEKRPLFSWSKDRSMPPWISKYAVNGDTK